MRLEKYTAFAGVLLIAGATGVRPARAASFGDVIAIGGEASDIALDESRGLLYIANFTANRIDVMSLANRAIHSSLNVAPQPGALAISPDAQFLLIAHYGNWAPTTTARNLLTLIHLGDGARRTISTGDPPLGVAFLADGRALIVTTTTFFLLEPASGTLQLLTTLDNLALTLPVPQATFPSLILKTAVAASRDGLTVWGVATTVDPLEVVYRYDVRRNQVSALAMQASPPLLPRVSVAADGSWAMIGYAIFTANLRSGIIRAQYPDVVASGNVTGHAIDTGSGIIYAQIPDAAQPSGPPGSAAVAVLSIMDADNLAVRDRLRLPENMVGRALLSSDGKTVFAVSDSGVMALPVGSLNQFPRIAPAQEDLLIHATFCNHQTFIHYLTLTDPGGGNTDFTIQADQPGVTVSPAWGSTPATVRVLVDPMAFQNRTGTTAVALTIASRSAVNFPQPVRLLVNNADPAQRGTVVNVPGRLSDMLADAARNRVYLLRQDRNLLLVYDGGNATPIVSLRTATTPTRMAFTIDRKYLVVGHDNAQVAYVFDLDALTQTDSILFPFGHYPRSMAESNSALLAVARIVTANSASGGSSASVGPPPVVPVAAAPPAGSPPAVSPAASAPVPAVIDRVDLPSRIATGLVSLGVWVNSLPAESALAPAPNGASILLAESDGNVKLYSAAADTFVASRKDFTSLQGAYAASSDNYYVVENHILNQSLVPVGTLDAPASASSGFAFVDRGGYFISGDPQAPGLIHSVAAVPTTWFKGVPVAEAPPLPGPGISFTRSVAPLAQGSSIATLSTSGLTVLAWNYDAAIAPPTIARVVNAADMTIPVAPGSLVSVFGTNLNPTNIATAEIPLPTAIGDSCLTANGAAIPMLFASPEQINAQLLPRLQGAVTLTLHTPGGTSNDYPLNVQPVAPGIFQNGTAGPLTGIPAVVKASNQQLVTPANPIHSGDVFTIYATGLGSTSPEVEAGLPGPAVPPAITVVPPDVRLGGVPLAVSYAGLAPGLVGVYQINAQAPGKAPEGNQVPLTVTQSGVTASVNVRVVD